MKRDEAIAKLRQVMKQSAQQKTDWDAVGAETSIQALGFDSISILDLIYDVQQAFEIDFEAEELLKLRTVGDLADFLLAQKGKTTGNG